MDPEVIAAKRINGECSNGELGMRRELEEGLFQALIEWLFSSKHPTVRWLQAMVLLTAVGAVGMMLVLPEESALRGWLAQWWWSVIGGGVLLVLLMRLGELATAAWTAFRRPTQRKRKISR